MKHRQTLSAALLLSLAGMVSTVGCDGESGETDCAGPNCLEDGLVFDPGVEDGETPACGEAAVTFTQRKPYVMLLVDQSGSMNDDFGDGTRWSVMRDALLDPERGLVPRLEADVRLGLALYTSRDGHEGGTCPMISSIGTSFGNASAIRDLFDAAEPVDETPTGESIIAIATQLTIIADNPDAPRAIVIATDGEPDTCDEPNPQNGQQVAVNAAEIAFKMGITTYVISVGDQVSHGHLQDLANAGVGLPVGGDKDARFYTALDQGELEGALDTIVNGVRGCVFTLEGEVVDGYEDEGTVVLDGEKLDKDDPDGWRLTNNKQVELTGAACETIQSGEHSLTIDFPCGGYEADPPR